MKDLPLFTTEHGVASLVLKEIPYQKTAYIILRDSLEPEALLKECADFCRVCEKYLVNQTERSLPTLEFYNRIKKL